MTNYYYYLTAILFDAGIRIKIEQFQMPIAAIRQQTIIIFHNVIASLNNFSDSTERLAFRSLWCTITAISTTNFMSEKTWEMLKTKSVRYFVIALLSNLTMAMNMAISITGITDSNNQHYDLLITQWPDRWNNNEQKNKEFDSEVLFCMK